MDKKYSNVIAMCLKSDEFCCVFDDCSLFKQCWPEEAAKLEKTQIKVEVK